MLICPVRHHSPAAALQVERLIQARRPQAVLVEGPADATALIPLLLDPADRARRWPSTPTAAAMRCARPITRSATYSPEYAALRPARQSGARLAFCDLPAAVTLDWHDEPSEADETAEPPEAGARLVPPVAAADPAPADYARFAAALASGAGFEEFEAFWEAAFEQDAGAQPPEGYAALLADFGEKARLLGDPARDEHDALRERHMAAAARALVADGMPADAIVLVCGAAHAAAIRAAFASPAEPPTIAEAAPAELALIPFSFPRLSEQSGYGAGNRAPWYYQQVWELGGDYPAATRRALLAVAAHLRQQGHYASLAQAIDGYTLAATLATMRGKQAPGVDELADAAVACFGQGQPAVVAAALQQVLIGDAVGRITPRVGRTPLQAEFYATAERLRLPVLDAPREVLVHLPVPVEAEQSVFLHRLAVADVPFAQELESGLGGGGRAARGGPLEQLGPRAREVAAALDPGHRRAAGRAHGLGQHPGRGATSGCSASAWPPRSASTTARPCSCAWRCAIWPRGSRRRWSAARRWPPTAPASARSPAPPTTWTGCWRTARRAACRRPGLGALAARLFARAVLHLPAAAVCGDDAAAEIEPAADWRCTSWCAAGAPPRGTPPRSGRPIETLAAQADSHPGLRGLALVLLELGGRLDRDALAARLRYWLSAAPEAADNARLVAGLFTLHRGTLVRNRALIGAVTDFLQGLVHRAAYATVAGAAPQPGQSQRGRADLPGGDAGDGARLARTTRRPQRPRSSADAAPGCARPTPPWPPRSPPGGTRYGIA